VIDFALDERVEIFEALGREADGLGFDEGYCGGWVCRGLCNTHEESRSGDEVGCGEKQARVADHF